MSDVPYDSIAEWYDSYLQERPIYREILLPHFLNLVGSIKDTTICDLACGQGFLSRELAIKGAKVIGIDISKKLLELARRYDSLDPLGITYLEDDAQTGRCLSDEGFDGVTCCMGLMPIPNIKATFQTTHRILKPNGWFVFAITHPCFQGPSTKWLTREDGTIAREVNGYFTERYWIAENSAGVRGKAGEYHRTLSTYLNCLVQTGLSIEQLVEPQATGLNTALEPGNYEVPSLLLVRAQKRGHT